MFEVACEIIQLHDFAKQIEKNEEKKEKERKRKAERGKKKNIRCSDAWRWE